jgi:hypothetical protein
MADENVTFKATVDDTEFLKAMERMETATQSLNKAVVANNDSAEQAVNTAGDAANAATGAVKGMEEGLTKAKAEFSQTTEKAKGFFGRIREGVRTIRDYKLSLGEVVQLLGMKAKASLQAAVSSGKLLSGVKALGKGLALLTTAGVVGLVLVALSALVTFMTKTEKGMNLVKQVIAGVSAAINVLVDRSEKVLNAFGSFFKGNFKKGFQELGGAVKGLTAEMIEEAKAAAALEKAFQNLEVAQVDLERRQLEFQRTLNQNRSIAEDETKAYRDRINALKENLDIEEVFNTEKVLQAEQNLELVKAEQALRADSVEKQKALNEAQMSLLEAEELRDASRRAIQKDILDLSKQRQAALEEERKQAEKLALQYAKLSEQLRDQVEKATIDQAEGLEKLELERDVAIRQVKEFSEELRAAAKEAGKVISPEQEADLQRLLDFIDAGFNEDVTKFLVKSLEEQILAQEAALDEKIAIQDATYQRELDFIDKRKAVQLAEVELLTDGTSKVLSLEEEKEVKRLEIARQALTNQLQLARERFGPDSLEVKLLEAQLAQIENTLEKASVGIGSLFDRIKGRLLDAFGLTPEQGAFFVDQFKSIFDSINSLALSNLETQLSINAQVIDGINERVDALEAALSEQEQLQAEGYANNVTALQQALNEENAALAAAEAQRLQLEKKAANERLIIDALQQASALALAAAKVITSESGKGLAGIITAVAGLALLFSIFAQAKANAAQFSSPTRLREGGQLDDDGRPGASGGGGRLSGPSHERGGIPVFLPGDIFPRYEAEGGEMVINRRATFQHLPFLEALNRGEFDGINLTGIAKEAQRRTLRPIMPIIVTQGKTSAKLSEMRYLLALEKTFDKISTKATAQLIDYWKTRPIDTPLDGGILREYFTGTTKVKQVIRKANK